MISGFILTQATTHVALLYRNLGLAHPEGYRKAIRLMQMADKSHISILCFVDTSGTYPRVGAEERGQAQAIAYNLREMAQIPSPIIVMVIDHVEAAQVAIQQACERMLSGQYHVLILDEVNHALVYLDFELIELKDVLVLLESKLPEMHIILTGRNAPRRSSKRPIS